MNNTPNSPIKALMKAYFDFGGKSDKNEMMARNADGFLFNQKPEEYILLMNWLDWNPMRNQAVAVQYMMAVWQHEGNGGFDDEIATPGQVRTHYPFVESVIRSLSYLAFVADQQNVIDRVISNKIN